MAIESGAAHYIMLATRLCEDQRAFLWLTVFFLIAFFKARFLVGVGAFTTNPFHVAAPMRFISLRRWLSQTREECLRLLIN